VLLLLRLAVLSQFLGFCGGQKNRSAITGTP
jgi:hypothetical protein